jgi:hypothetical protein
MVQDYVYVVRSGPADGRDEAYNDWYTNVHLADVLAVPGFVSAQRFCVADPAAPDAPVPGYLALYTMRTDNPEGLLAKLTSLVESGQMAMSEAFDMETVTTALYRALTPVVVCKTDAEA